MSLSGMKLETDRYLDISAKISVDDIDWKLAGQVGASDDEAFIITYFSDIEGQTIIYLRDLLGTRAGTEPEVIGFLSMWNYEEYFHGRVLARYLEACGKPLNHNRLADVRKSASFSETAENWASKLLSKIFAAEFPAVHAAWGAIQEITTLRGYEALAELTPNPVLKILCDRIAKQERRHYAWYFNSARERLEGSVRAQRLTRFLLSNFWSPVGAGVKPDKEVAKLMTMLFAKEGLEKVATEIDAKIGTLPGLAGISLMTSYVDKKSKLAFQH